jgi:hypothetical protein
MSRRKLVSGEEMLALMDFKKKKPVVGNVSDYAESVEVLTDHDLYMIWRDAILANGHTPTRYLNRPKNKELGSIRCVYATFCQGYDGKQFPHFLNKVFGGFDKVKTFINTAKGGYMLFEVHMLGMLLYQITPILTWYEENN